MKKIKYPYFNEKGSIHLMKKILKDSFVCAFEGGDLLKRVSVLKCVDVWSSLDFLYPHLVKLSKPKKMKFKGFYWFIKYYVPKENQIKYYKKNKKYKDSLEKSAHLLELICSNYDDHKKLNVSSDLFLTDNHTVKFPRGKTMESIVLASKLLKDLKEINFKLGFLQKGLPHYGWLKPSFSQDKYLLDKLDQPAWFTVEFQIKTLFNKKFRSDLESLQYLRKKISPKIKFTFDKLDKVEKKIMKKYKIIK